MGNLIAAAPREPREVPRDRIRTFISTCVRCITRGNLAAFGRMTGVNQEVIYGCLLQNTIPTTPALLKICYRLRVPLSLVLTNSDISNYIESNIQNIISADTISMSMRSNSHRAYPQLLAALDEDPPPTLQDVAERVGYKIARSLRKRCPELSRMLTERRKEMLPKRRRRSANRRFDHNELQSALQKLLKKDCPPTLQDIAEILGFADASPLRRNFKYLSQAIVRRRAAYVEKMRFERRAKMEATLGEVPPPSLPEVAKRLGYETSLTLQRFFPDLSEAVSRRYLDYRSTKRAQVRDKLQTLLLEDPPLSLRRVANSLKKSVTTLHKHYPQECRAVVARYAEYRTRTCIDRKRAIRIRLKEIAISLHIQGIYPSGDQVRKTFNQPIGLTPSEVCDLLREVRFELGLRKRGGPNWLSL